MGLKMNRLKGLSRSRAIVTAKASIPVYLDVHPLSDYEPIGRLGAAWIGEHRQNSSRQLVVVQQCRQNILSGFRRYLQLAHLHLARPIALYSARDVYLSYEYVELGLEEILPLSDSEVASVLSQVMSKPSTQSAQQRLTLPR